MLKKSPRDDITVVAAGITLFEALQAYEELKDEGIFLRIIDLYSIKPIDGATLKEAARKPGPSSPWKIIMPKEVWERRSGAPWPESGTAIYSLAVRRMPEERSAGGTSGL